METFLTSKGLYLKPIGDGRYVLQDVFGVCTLPFQAADIESATARAFQIGRAALLCEEAELKNTSGFDGYRWYELEKFYVAELTDYFRYWQVGSDKVPWLDVMSGYLPLAYEDWGFGEGGAAALEDLHNRVKALVADQKVPYTEQLVDIRLAYVQLRRMCSDLMALIQRSIRAFFDLLLVLRAAIMEESKALLCLNAAEIKHTGPKSRMVATCTTMCVVSLCTSLDISAKILYFVNACIPPLARFKAAQGKRFSDLESLKSRGLDQDVVDKLLALKKSKADLLSLIQFRHDLIHNTTAIEMERVYVGHGTAEINGLPLHYSSVPWRDCEESGQPVRCLGRDYFVSNGVDMEFQLHKWINSVVDYHIQVGAACVGQMKLKTVPDAGVQLIRGK